VALDLLAAFAVGSMAVAGGQSWTEVARGAAAVAVRSPMGAAHVGRPMAGLTRTLPDTARPVLRASAVSAALLLVFGALFVSADGAFADLADRLLVPEITLGLLPARVAVLVLVAGLVGAGLLAARAEPAVGLARPPGTASSGCCRWSCWTCSSPPSSGVQFAVFFGGQEHLLRTAGLTAAEHARQGFFQLLAVAAMTLALVAVAVRRPVRATARCCACCSGRSAA
jgi:hypothetical protein